MLQLIIAALDVVLLGIRKSVSFHVSSSCYVQLFSNVGKRLVYHCDSHKVSVSGASEFLRVKLNRYSEEFSASFSGQLDQLRVTSN
ncbi:uncharacterized protein DEA37_0011885 [Paragonimus westermani]|uniref:Secreted protein n=1 Tax=Paragonimus westermani TaxID=34504 RepID=A0A5J4NG54_9TREM|nr:uncharacterized protein DEA37_0011885 [Paragonimus westermani]